MELVDSARIAFYFYWKKRRQPIADR